jgi:hypothetical protein
VATSTVGKVPVPPLATVGAVVSHPPTLAPPPTAAPLAPVRTAVANPPSNRVVLPTLIPLLRLP